jgi:hypothetical protein
MLSSISALRFGAFFKRQAVTGYVCGTPSVTTNIGAMFGNFQWNGFIDDNPQDFANSAIELYQNQHSWLEHNLRSCDC